MFTQSKPPSFSSSIRARNNDEAKLKSRTLLEHFQGS
jgi:hypothetical protein